MLSRVAENLYWISRYVERAENVARLLDVGFHLELDASGLAGDVSGQGPIESVLTILACREAFEKAHGAEPQGPRGRPPLPHLRPPEQPLDPRHARPGPRERPGDPGDAQRRGLEPGQQALPLPGQPPGPAPVRRQPVAVLRRDQAGLHPLRRPGRRHPAPDRGLPLPPARPLPGAGQPDQPDPQRQAPRAPRRRADRGAADADRPLVEPAPELLGLRGVPPRAPRPDRPRGRGPLPRPRRRLPPGHAVLRRPLLSSRSARSPAATRTSTAPRPNASSAGSTASCATSTSTRSSAGASPPSSTGIQDACNRVGDEIHQAYFLT